MSLAPAHPGASVQAQAPEPLSQEVIAHLTAIVGPGGVITNPSALLVYESDGLMSYRVRPRALIAPRSTEQVSAVLRSLAHLGIPFVPRGAGTGLSGGALALERAVLLSLARMDRILSIDPVSRIARVEPGVVNVKLTAAARPHGLYYAPDPSSQTVCTIGGNVAENAGGPHCLKHGVTLNHIAGATVVLSDGSVVRLGGAAGETVGYDLLGLFIGSEGTFGVATELEVRLARVPEFVATLLALFDDINDASRAVTSIIADGLLPAALEMVDREAIRAVEASIYAAGLPTDVAGALVIEFDGTPAAVHADARRAVSLCEQNRARSVRLATDEAERQRLWYARKKAFGAMGRLAPDVMVQDGVVPRSKLPEVLARVYAIAAAHGLRTCNMFHAGDGNLHPTILFDRRDPAQIRKVEAASREMMQAFVDAGGTITGEHGVGMDKSDYMPLVFSERELQAMCDVRRAWDPRGLANPAKILPVRVCREWTGPATRRATPGA